MRIIYFNYIVGLNAHPAGALAKSTSYIRELKAKGFDVQVNWQNMYVKNGDENGEKAVYRSPFRMFVSRFIHEPYKIVQNIFQIFRQLKKVRTFKPDVIFERLEHCYFASAFVAKLTGLPLVVEADAPVVYEYRKFYGRGNLHVPFLPKLIETYTLKRADAVFCISSQMKNYYTERGIDPDKMVVTPNGCNPGMFYPKPRVPELEERLNIKGQIVIGWVGSLYGWSGIENLIRLVQDLAGENENVSFLFVGGGKNRELFADALLDQSYSDRIHLPGPVGHEEINDYLSCMDIVLAPYPKMDFWYASSMKVFEYMAAGKALITSRIGQLKEIIHDRGNGLLYEPDNFAELRQRVRELIGSRTLRESLGRNAHRTALAEYTWSVLAERMAATFRSVYEKGRRDRSG